LDFGLKHLVREKSTSFRNFDEAAREKPSIVHLTGQFFGTEDAAMILEDEFGLGHVVSGLFLSSTFSISIDKSSSESVTSMWCHAPESFFSRLFLTSLLGTCQPVLVLGSENSFRLGQVLHKLGVPCVICIHGQVCFVFFFSFK
jgi:hypothetical protein